MATSDTSGAYPQPVGKLGIFDLSAEILVYVQLRVISACVNILYALHERLYEFSWGRALKRARGAVAPDLNQVSG